jgi:hypothetical protein
MKLVLARPALLAALALAVGACSADRAVAPAPPSLATGAVPIHQEPTPLPPESDSTWKCMRFDALAVGTRWGADKGTVKGTVVHSEDYIRMKLTDYLTPSGTGTAAQYRHAVIDTARYDSLYRHALRLDTVGVVFDFTQVPFYIDSVTFYYVDRSPLENMQVVGNSISSAIHLDQISNWPLLDTRVAVSLHALPMPVRGRVRILGDVDSVRIGGSNDPPSSLPGVTGLWLDRICWYKGSKAHQETPYPL